MAQVRWYFQVINGPSGPLESDMYILINTDEMTFVEKHESLEVITNLAWLSLRNTAYDIFPIDDASGFAWYTDLDLKTLYRNTVNLDWPHEKRNALKQVLFDIAQRLSVSVVNPVEVEAQAERIAENDEQLYTYVRGSRYPAPVEVLSGGLFVKPDQESENAALSGKTPALKPVKKPLPLPTESDRLVSATPTKGEKQNGPKRGTAKAIIWETADRMWEQAGKPTEKSEVLKLRKTIMDELEKEAIKRSSSSSELGVWHKTRIPE